MRGDFQVSMEMYVLPAINMVGAGCVNRIGRESVRLGGKKALVVASIGEVGEAQAKQIGDILQNAGIEAVLFPKATPNPTEETVTEGAAFYKANNCDMLAAVGGGSAIDAAKGIGIIVSNGGNIADYEGSGKVKNVLPPFVAIATTAGTGSEVTQFAVISDINHNKRTIVDRHMVPTISVNDPEMMLSMPPSLTAATGMDALTHAIEAYVSNKGTPINACKAWEAIKLVAENLPVAVKNGHDITARENMCCASFLAGIAFNNAGLGLVHAMSHPLGGHYNLPHGLCNALLLHAVCNFNLTQETAHLFADISMALGAGRGWGSDRDNAEAALKAIKNLQHEVGFTKGLKEYGVKREDFSMLAELALLESVGKNNPRRFTKEDVIALYEECYW